MSTNTLHIDLLEEILWTGFSGTLWCTASSFAVEFSIVWMLTEDAGWPEVYKSKGQNETYNGYKKFLATATDTYNNAWCYLRKADQQFSPLPVFYQTFCRGKGAETDWHRRFQFRRNSVIHLSSIHAGGGVHPGALTHRQTLIHAHIDAYEQFSVTYQPNLHVALWEEIRNSCKHVEKRQNAQREDWAGCQVQSFLLQSATPESQIASLSLALISLTVQDVAVMNILLPCVFTWTKA